MLALVTANDLLQMFFGWEGVGLASYLLIGFWYDKKAPNDAAIKAFVVNRIGDFGFALGIVACFVYLGTIKFFPTEAGDLTLFSGSAGGAAVAGQLERLSQMNVALGNTSVRASELVAVLLFIGAMGKSAQFFLHTWLPDAMEGPTPVSALIHAATMVTAGVFMVCRLSELYELAPYAAGLVTIIGAVTAFFAATVGLAQNDIKRVVAYSTCSQLGYMFFAAGVGAYNVAMFHLFTHAFFKALLFLGAGSVIHGLHHEQDMRNMGALRKPMTITWAMMGIGTIALIGFGIPGLGGFAGFYSKDAAIEAAYGAGEAGRMGGQFAFWAGVVAAALTSFYSWRLMFMTFEGTYRGTHGANHAPGHGEEHGEGAPAAAANHAVLDRAPPGAHSTAHAGKARPRSAPARIGLSKSKSGKPDFEARGPGAAAPAHESPNVMLVPLYVLAAGAVFAGAIFAPYFIGQSAEGFWRGVVHLPHAEHHFPAWVVWAPVGVTVAGFILALIIYYWNQGMGERIARATGPLHAFLYHKWFFDEIYDFVLVKGGRALGDFFWKAGDQKTIDGLGPDGMTSAARFFSRQLRRVQTGFVYHYSFLMLIAAVAFGAYAIWASGVVR
jgi:NADH-quinone oxidoreductase subunit L